MKKFPRFVHMSLDGESKDEYFIVTDGVQDLEPGQRVAIYELFNEGTVVGPKSFMPKKPKRKTR